MTTNWAALLHTVRESRECAYILAAGSGCCARPVNGRTRARRRRGLNWFPTWQIPAGVHRAGAGLVLTSVQKATRANGHLAHRRLVLPDRGVGAAGGSPSSLGRCRHLFLSLESRCLRQKRQQTVCRRALRRLPRAPPPGAGVVTGRVAVTSRSGPANTALGRATAGNGGGFGSPIFIPPQSTPTPIALPPSVSSGPVSRTCVRPLFHPSIQSHCQ